MTISSAIQDVADFERALHADDLQTAEQIALSLCNSQPDQAQALARLGAVRLMRGKLDEAITALSSAVRLRPSLAEAHSDLGFALILMHRPLDALAHLDAALAHKPEFAVAHSNRGMAFLALDRAVDALTAFDKALSLSPSHIDALSNRGSALMKLRRYDEAVSAFTHAIALRPDLVEALFGRGNALVKLGRLDEAIADYDSAIARNPGYADASTAKGEAKLLAGDFVEGWALYENRWRASTSKLQPRTFPGELWLGDRPIAGRRILIHAEQGFGDTIQFCRLTSLLVERGGHVTLLIPPDLLELFRASPLSVELCVPGDTVAAFELHCPLMSLPYALKMTPETIPAAIPYLAPPTAKVAQWAERLGPQTRPRIGLAWSGRRSHINNSARSIDLKVLSRLLALDAEFHCLQTEFSDEDQALLSTQGVPRYFSLPQRDFSDTAAHIAAMDLVIAVDTSVVHLAGALGKPVWVMLAYVPDFRWMLTRADSPWYPTARLIRQSRPGDWLGVVERVTADLADWLANKT